jgi:hypothetical protein
MKYLCEFCYRFFTSVYKYKQHIKYNNKCIRHRSKNWESTVCYCQTCNKEFSTKGNYNHHLKSKKHNNRIIIIEDFSNIQQFNIGYLKKIGEVFQPYFLNGPERLAHNIIRFLSGIISLDKYPSVICVNVKDKVFIYMDSEFKYEKDHGGYIIIPIICKWVLSKIKDINKLYQESEYYNMIFKCIIQLLECSRKESDNKFFSKLSSSLAKHIYGTKKQRDFAIKHIGVKLK